MQRRLIVEEFKEFLDAENQLIMGLTVNAAECLKELADLVYVCYQYAENLGWDLDAALDRVHESNLSKLGCSLVGSSRDLWYWSGPFLN